MVASTALFVLGVLSSFGIVLASFVGRGEDKRGGVAFPFMMLVAAAVGKYLGF